jgi:hypothetical protein
MPLMAAADELQLRDDAPDKYVVAKGDTLWDISAKFFKSPWRWTEIWGLNKDTIKDPHWIYPGDVVYLDPKSKTLLINQVPVAQSADTAPAPSQAATETAATQTEETPEVAEIPGSPNRNAVKFQPKIKVLPGTSSVIPTISLSVIGPFLKRPLVIEEDELDGAPRIIGTQGHKELLGEKDVAYVSNMPNDQGKRWQIYRPTTTFIDPDTREILGNEVIYLGDAHVEKFDDISTVNITKSVLEIQKGDYLAQASTGFSTNYLPRAPSFDITARVISIYGGVDQAGQSSVITLNKGRRDGLEEGHVLAVYIKGDTADSGSLFKRNIQLPDIRSGLIFVFRVFEKVSYAVVLESNLPIKVLDRASTPE